MLPNALRFFSTSSKHPFFTQCLQTFKGMNLQEALDALPKMRIDEIPCCLTGTPNPISQIKEDALKEALNEVFGDEIKAQNEQKPTT